MTIVKIIGSRQTGRTSILIDIAKRCLKNNLKVLLIVLNDTTAKKIVWDQNWFKETRIKVTCSNSIQVSHFDIILIDNADFMSEKFIKEIYSYKKESAIIYMVKDDEIIDKKILLKIEELEKMIRKYKSSWNKHKECLELLSGGDYNE